MPRQGASHEALAVVFNFRSRSRAIGKCSSVLAPAIGEPIGAAKGAGEEEGTSPAPAQKLRSCVPSAITTRQPSGSNPGTIGGRSAPWSWSRTAAPHRGSPLACKTLHHPSVAIRRCGGSRDLQWACPAEAYGENTWQPSAHWQARRVVRKIKQIPEVALRSRVGAHSLPPKSIVYVARPARSVEDRYWHFAGKMIV